MKTSWKVMCGKKLVCFVYAKDEEDAIAQAKARLSKEGKEAKSFKVEKLFGKL